MRCTNQIVGREIVAFFATVLAVVSAGPIFGQDSEYSQPAFDPEHDHDSFLPVETVDLFSGALILVYTDISLPGPHGFDLNVRRWYNSKINRWDPNCLTASFEETSLGIGWHMHMGRLWENPVTTATPAFRLELPGGLTEEFHTDDTLLDPIGVYVSKNGWSQFSEFISGTSYETVVSPGGVKYRFAVANRHNPSGEYLYLSEMVDPVGSRISVTYANRGDSNAYVDTATDAFGRVVRFFYQDNTVHLDDPDRLDRITVLDHNGGTATYDYNVVEAGFTFHNVLGSFTLPIGLTTSYDYSIQSGDSSNDVELKRITLPTAGTIQYTYADHTFYYPLRNTGNSNECTRVVTRKVVDGTATWNYTQPTGQPTDRTVVVTDPLGHQERSTFFRYSSTGPDRIWKTGLLERREVWNGSATQLLQEDFVYQPRQYSSDNISPLSGYIEAAQLGLLTEKRVTHRGTRTAKTTWSGHDDYNNPAVMSEFDFSQVLYRTTRYEYEHSNADGDDITFLNAHLVDRVTRTVVERPLGTVISEQRAGYDATTGGGSAFGNVSFAEGWYSALTGDGGGSGYTHTEYDYDTVGDISVMRQAGGTTRTTNFTYDRGILKRVMIAGSMIMDRTIDLGTSLVESQSDGNGHTTTFTYDSWNRLTRIHPPIGSDTVLTYDNTTGSSTTVARGGSEILYSYDHFGRLTTTRTKLTPSTFSYRKVGYDAKGQVQYRYEASTSASPSTRTTFTYDGMGRTLTSADPDGNSSFSYGADTTTIVDPESNQTVQTFDAFGRLIQVQEPGSHVTIYGYDGLDNLTSVQHPGTAGNRTFRYNSLGWLLEETNPESGNTRYGHNAFGEIVWKRDANGTQSTLSYDARGRMSSIDFPADPDIQFYYDGQAVPGHSATYGNANNNLTGMSDETGTTLWATRDNLGRVTRVERKLGNATYFLTYAYDTRGNLSQLDYPRLLGSPSRTRVDYTYTEANLVDSIVVNATSVLVPNIDYNPAFRPTRFDYANGVTVELPTSPALRNRPDAIFTNGATANGGDGDINLDYTYNSRGLISRIVTNGRVDDYTYFPRALLKDVTYGAQGMVQYNYDATGNMLSRQSAAFPSLTFARTYSANRIVGRSYSPSGNLLGDGTQSYIYARHDKLRTVTGKTEYRYSAQGLREVTLFPLEDKKLVDFHDEQQRLIGRFAGTLEGVSEPERDFIYAGDRLVSTVHHLVVNDIGATLRTQDDPADVVLEWEAPQDDCATSYEVLRATEPSFGTYAVLTDPPIATTTYRDVGARSLPGNHYYRVRATVSETSWIVTDHRGSARIALNSTGEVQGTYETFAFGEPKATSCEQWDGGYQGSLREGETGLYDLGARHYSDGLARFLVPDRIQPDPRLPLGWNAYVYSNNDPVNLSDPDGRAADTPNGGVNHLRNINISSDGRGFSNVMEIATNLVAGSFSEYVDWDYIVDTSALTLDNRRSAVERTWSGTKVVGAAALTVVGGSVAKRAFKSVRWVWRYFTRAKGAPAAGLEAIEKGAAAVIAEGADDAARGIGGHIDDVLRPGGQLLGNAGTRDGIRIVRGGAKEAEETFLRLADGGIDITPAGHPGRLVELRSGGFVGYRPVSASGPPTIDVKIPGYSIDKIKYVP